MKLFFKLGDLELFFEMKNYNEIEIKEKENIDSLLGTLEKLFSVFFHFIFYICVFFSSKVKDKIKFFLKSNNFFFCW